MQLCSQACPAILRDAQGIQPIQSGLGAQDVGERLRGLCPSEAPAAGVRSGGEPGRAHEHNIADRPFERSGGGVTLSGGEPHAARLRRRAAGPLQGPGAPYRGGELLHVPRHQIEPSLPTSTRCWRISSTWMSELLRLDLRQGRPALANLGRLAERGVHADPGAIIPGFNADRESIKAITDTAARLGTVQEIHFLPYHTLGRVNMPC